MDEMLYVLKFGKKDQRDGRLLLDDVRVVVFSTQENAEHWLLGYAQEWFRINAKDLYNEADFASVESLLKALRNIPEDRPSFDFDIAPAQFNASKCQQ